MQQLSTIRGEKSQNSSFSIYFFFFFLPNSVKIRMSADILTFRNSSRWWQLSAVHAAPR